MFLCYALLCCAVGHEVCEAVCLFVCFFLDARLGGYDMVGFESLIFLSGYILGSCVFGKVVVDYLFDNSLLVDFFTLHFI